MTTQVLVKKLRQAAQLPTQAYPGDAGYDLYSAERVVIPSGGASRVYSGLALAMMNGWWCEVRGRSSSAIKHDLHVAACVIDCGFRGELFVFARNHGDKPFTVEVGDRIAQLVFHATNIAHFIESPELPETERGEKGFGSSGR